MGWWEEIVHSEEEAVLEEVSEAVPGQVALVVLVVLVVQVAFVLGKEALIEETLVVVVTFAVLLLQVVESG